MLSLRKKTELNLVSPSRMSELLLTRFTHDISGPISAVTNGLEFLMIDAKDTDDPGGIEIKNQAIDLVEESSKQSLARLQAYRIAYGVVYKDDAETETKEVILILKNFFHRSQIEIRWNGSVPDKIPAAIRRICVCMILTMSRILIYGGKISVSFAGEGKKTVIIRGTATKFKDPTNIKHILMDEKAIEPDVENVPYFFIKDMSRRSNVNISFDYEDKESSGKSVTFECVMP